MPMKSKILWKTIPMTRVKTSTPFSNFYWILFSFLAGLRWEDLIISARPAVAEAMELADADVMKGRLRRLKRASDLTYKGKVYTDYADPAGLEPFKLELWPDVQKIEAREEEYALLDLHKK